MPDRRPASAPLLAALVLATLAAACTGPAAHLESPPTRRGDRVDLYHGVEVADPYRWMEDEESAETRAWVAAQGMLLDRYLAAGPGPALADLERRLERIHGFERYTGAQRAGGLELVLRFPSGAARGEILARRPGEPFRTVVDLSAVVEAPLRTFGFTPSDDGAHVVWAARHPAGWGWLQAARVADGALVDAPIPGVRGNSAVWSADHGGFWYVSYGDPEALIGGAAEPRARLLYHRLGTDPAEDEEVYAPADRPSLLMTPKLSADGRYLVLELYEGTGTVNTLLVRDLEGGTGFVEVIAEADAAYVFEAAEGRRLFLRTDLDAPRGRLVVVDLDRPQRRHWRQVIPQRQSNLNGVSHVGGLLLVQTTRHALPGLEVWSPQGELLREVELPSVGLLAGLPDQPDAPVTYVRTNNLVDPGTVYRLDLRDGASEVVARPDLPYDPDDYEIRQVFYGSFDGTRVPMFLVHRREVPLQGDNPLLMYGYGHGGWVAFPWFQPHLVAWLDLGGTYALPGLRGGGEYGAEWQRAGERVNKPNTLGDYLAAAEWLIDNGYTGADKLVANGGSASGVVPAAAVVRRPDLFAAALIDFPFLDMLRYHHFTTIPGWTRGYGSAEDPEEFKVLHGYSPLHNLEQGRCYPAVLTVVGEEDTATVPMHGYKFTAALQHAQGCPNPVLLKAIPGAGHYQYGTDVESTIRTEAEILRFLLRAVDGG